MDTNKKKTHSTKHQKLEHQINATDRKKGKVIVFIHRNSYTQRTHFPYQAYRIIIHVT